MSENFFGSNKDIVVIGAGNKTEGFLAATLAQAYGNRVHLVRHYVSPDPVELSSLLEGLRPKVVVNMAQAGGSPAAMQKLEPGSPDWRLCEATNIELRLALAKLSVELDYRYFDTSTLAHCDWRAQVTSSSDWRTGYNEELAGGVTLDSPGLYLQMKMEGDEQLRELMETIDDRRRIIVGCIHLPIGSIDHPRNLLTRMRTWQTFAREVISLTSAQDFVTTLIRLVDNPDTHGFFNLVNPGFISLADVARKMNAQGLTVRKDIIENSMWDIENAAPQARVVAYSSRLNLFNISQMPPVEYAVDRTVEAFAQRLATLG